MNDFLSGADDASKGKKRQFRSVPKPSKTAVSAATGSTIPAPKDKRKKKPITVRFSPAQAVAVDKLDEFCKILAAEMSESLNYEVDPLPRNDIAVWCILRGIEALESGERPPLSAGKPRLG